ncbi:MAG: STAS domain-containing protein [bacterium]
MSAMEPFQLETSDCGGITVIRPLVREITYRNSRAFYQHVRELVSGLEPFLVVLDLGDVEVVDSRSLGILVAISNHARQKGGRVAIARPTAPVRELFDLLKFDQVFSFFPTVAEAAGHLSAAPRPVDAGGGS